MGETSFYQRHVWSKKPHFSHLNFCIKNIFVMNQWTIFHCSSNHHQTNMIRVLDPSEILDFKKTYFTRFLWPSGYDLAPKTDILNWNGLLPLYWRYPPNLPTLRWPTWLQSESRQYDNKYIYPDCRYRLILLEFTGCGWHSYIIINFILEGYTIVLSMTQGLWSLWFLRRNWTTVFIFFFNFFYIL